jgi:hypothetical protein
MFKSSLDTDDFEDGFQTFSSKSQEEEEMMDGIERIKSKINNEGTIKKLLIEIEDYMKDLSNIYGEEETERVEEILQSFSKSKLTIESFFQESIVENSDLNYMIKEVNEKIDKDGEDYKYLKGVIIDMIIFCSVKLTQTKMKGKKGSRCKKLQIEVISPYRVTKVFMDLLDFNFMIKKIWNINELKKIDFYKNANVFNRYFNFFLFKYKRMYLINQIFNITFKFWKNFIDKKNIYQKRFELLMKRDDIIIFLISCSGKFEQGIIIILFFLFKKKIKR